MKKVVLIYLGRRGAGPVYAFEMAKALSTRCNLLCVISRNISNREQWRELSKYSDEVSLYEIKTYNSLMEFVYRSFFIWQYVKVVRYIDNFSPDMIYSPMGHFWEKFIFPYVRCHKRIQTIHDVILHKGEDSCVHKFCNFLFSYRTEKYVILSEIFKEILLSKGIDKRNIIVIPHAVFKQDNRKELDTRTYHKFLFFGRIIKYKGLEVLLQSMQRIVDIYPDAILSIVGNGDIRDYECLMKKCELNLETHIGWIDDSDIEYYFADVDFVVLPYIQASQSGVISLAYSFGKPVIATRVGGLPAQVIENRTGILISPNNVEELTAAISDLLKNEKQLKYMKEQCWMYALEHTWETSASILLSAFDR